tara:strand:- start:370 stop:984 length:615 start_codon:yes stop_codon:yes gene_type:complete
MKSPSSLSPVLLVLFAVITVGHVPKLLRAGQHDVVLPGSVPRVPGSLLARLWPRENPGKPIAVKDGRFKLVYQEKGPRDASRKIQVSQCGDATIFEIRDQFGIGSGTIQRVARAWPGKILVRLHLGGLEGFSLTVGKKVLARTELKVRMLDSKGKPLPGRYLVKPAGPNGSKRIEGYYEVAVPARILTADVKEIKLNWVDFYRR